MLGFPDVVLKFSSTNRCDSLTSVCASAVANDVLGVAYSKGNVRWEWL